jgi:hypothetical protein
MRDKQEVEDKFREMSERHLKERKEQFLGRCPINCVHNIRLHVKGKGKLGFCQNPLVLARCAPHKMFVCNEKDTACRCRLFVCKNTEEQVESTFKDILRAPSRVGQEYPKLAMLIWFLQDYDSKSRCKRLGQSIWRLFISVWGLLTCRWW